MSSSDGKPSEPSSPSTKLKEEPAPAVVSEESTKPAQAGAVPPPIKTADASNSKDSSSGTPNVPLASPMTNLSNQNQAGASSPSSSESKGQATTLPPTADTAAKQSNGTAPASSLEAVKAVEEEANEGADAKSKQSSVEESSASSEPAKQSSVEESSASSEPAKQSSVEESSASSEAANQGSVNAPASAAGGAEGNVSKDGPGELDVSTPKIGQETPATSLPAPTPQTASESAEAEGKMVDDGEATSVAVTSSVSEGNPLSETKQEGTTAPASNAQPGDSGNMETDSVDASAAPPLSTTQGQGGTSSAAEVDKGLTPEQEREKAQRAAAKAEMATSTELSDEAKLASLRNKQIVEQLHREQFNRKKVLHKEELEKFLEVVNKSFTPSIPEEVIQHVASKSGFMPTDSTVLKTLSLLTHQFIIEVARECAIIAKQRNDVIDRGLALLSAEVLVLALRAKGVTIAKSTLVSDFSGMIGSKRNRADEGESTNAEGSAIAGASNTSTQASTGQPPAQVQKTDAKAQPEAGDSAPAN